MYIFSEQTFTDMYTDNSYFNQHTKQSTATCQNAEKPQRIVSYQFLNKRSTECAEVVKSCFVTAAKPLFHCKTAFFIVWSPISFDRCLTAFSMFELGDSVTVRHHIKATQDFFNTLFLMSSVLKNGNYTQRA